MQGAMEQPAGVPVLPTGAAAQATRPVPQSDGVPVPPVGAAAWEGIPTAQAGAVPAAVNPAPSTGAPVMTGGYPAAGYPAPAGEVSQAGAAAPVGVAAAAGAAAPTSIEERLGVRLAVWIGSIALALAGAYLVKYSVDQGWFSPAVRVSMGLAFGLAMIAAGERLRRSSARVSQGLSAAGVADLFACLLAAVQLYELVPPGVGFALMAATTALAVVLALRQGPIVAVVGLVGGFLAPALIRVSEPDARNLFGYLLLLEVGLLAVSRRRGWTGVSMLASGAGLLWALAWIAGPLQPGDAVWLDLFLVLTAGTAAATAMTGAPRTGRTAPALLAGGTAVLSLFAAAQLAQQTGNSPTEWASFALIASGLIVLGRIDGALAGLAWVAAGVGAAMLIGWSSGEADDPGRRLLTTLALGALFAVGGYVAAIAFARRGAPRPALWMALSAAASVAYFLIAFATSEQRHREMPWGAWAVGLAVLYALAAVGFARRRGPAATAWDAPLAAAAVAATAFASLAVPIELERAWLSLAWAVEVPVLLFLAGRFRIPALTLLARALAVLVVLRLAFNPGVVDYPIGPGRLLNWLLPGYGVPLLAFAAGAWLSHRQRDRITAGGLELGALALAFAYLTVEIAQIFHPGEPDGTPVSLAQWGSWTAAWLLLGWGALAAGRRTDREALALGGIGVVWIGLGATLLAQGLLANPFWFHRPIGATPVWNLLLWIYGVPAALLVAAAREASRRAAEGRGAEAVPFFAGLSARMWRVTALGLAFGLVSAEVRQLFHGTYLDGDETSLAERWAYSAAWTLFAAALLVLGIVRRGRLLRYSSLAVMLVVVLKVFLYDTSSLTGLYRVGSLLGLGATLLLLAHLYGRYVFRDSGRESTP